MAGEVGRLWIVADALDPAADQWTLEGGDDAFPEWQLRFTAARTPRGAEIVELVVTPVNEAPEGGIQTRLLRAISPPGLLSLVVEAASLSARETEDLAVNAWTATQRPGKAGRSDYEYAVWTARYVEALSSRSPVADLAGRWHLSESQIRNILHACRGRELLTESAPGRAGGDLTDKARRLLRERGEERQ